MYTGLLSLHRILEKRRSIDRHGSGDLPELAVEQDFGSRIVTFRKLDSDDIVDVMALNLVAGKCTRLDLNSNGSRQPRE